MEKTVRILEQSALSTRKYTDKKSGQEKVQKEWSGKGDECRYLQTVRWC